MPIPLFPFPARYIDGISGLLMAGKGSRKERGLLTCTPKIVPIVR
jgi:hypothetical protein